MHPRKMQRDGIGECGERHTALPCKLVDGGALHARRLEQRQGCSLELRERPENEPGDERFPVVLEHLLEQPRTPRDGRVQRTKRRHLCRVFRLATLLEDGVVPERVRGALVPLGGVISQSRVPPIPCAYRLVHARSVPSEAVGDVRYHVLRTLLRDVRVVLEKRAAGSDECVAKQRLQRKGGSAHRERNQFLVECVKHARACHLERDQRQRPDGEFASSRRRKGPKAAVSREVRKSKAEMDKRWDHFRCEWTLRKKGRQFLDDVLLDGECKLLRKLCEEMNDFSQLTKIERMVSSVRKRPQCTFKLCSEKCHLC